jgi:hypothetical protein
MIVVKMHVSKSSQKCSIQVKTISLELAETRGPLLSLSLSLSVHYQTVHILKSIQQGLEVLNCHL